MAITGKTGADAVFKALSRICIVLSHYRAKLDGIIDTCVTEGVITSAQATVAHDFLASANTVCAVFDLVAGYSGFHD